MLVYCLHQSHLFSCLHSSLSLGVQIPATLPWLNATTFMKEDEKLKKMLQTFHTVKENVIKMSQSERKLLVDNVDT